MRLLLACMLVALAAADGGNPRVQFFDGPQYNSFTRTGAAQVCQGMNTHLAHESQILADIADGFPGFHECGWTWTRGTTVHAHCLETDASGTKCVPGRSELRPCSEADETPVARGVYCRVFGDEEERPLIELEKGELISVYRAEGPNGPNSIMNVNEAKAVCEADGNNLAYWTQVSAYIERYGVQICKYCWMREINAVFNANCKNNDEIGWQVRNPKKGYDAICVGIEPHRYRDPCAGTFEFANLEGVPISCSDDGYIIIQDRPYCNQEEYTFKQEWEAYKKGFGEVGKGYWIGLDILAKLTKAYPFELVVEMESDGEGHYSARYGSFKVGGEEDNYRLRVDDYSGDAGDMFNEIQSNSRTSNGAQFSANKHDNDGSDTFDCAREFASGWWFQSCHLDNLNGPCPGEEAYSERISATRSWRKVSNNTPGLRSTRMKIKYVSG